jgi:hypothetical protein
MLMRDPVQVFVAHVTFPEPLVRMGQGVIMEVIRHVVTEKISAQWGGQSQ